MRVLINFLRRRPIEDEQITYAGGETVRRIQHRRRTEWFVNGVPTSAAEAKAFQQETRERLETARPGLRP